MPGPKLYTKGISIDSKPVQSTTFFDFCVNRARVYVNASGHLVLESSVAANSAGNFNGGGTGNKPIVGVDRSSGIPIAQLPRLLAEVALRTTDKLGLSYNVFVDLAGDGNGPFVVVDLTSTLNSVVDKYGETGAAASLTDFDITNFALLGDTTGNAFVSGGQSLNNAFYVVNNLPTYGGALAWFSNPVNLDILLNGGVMPLTGEIFVGGFPNAKLVATGYVSDDGGMPKGTPVTPITLQIGGSSNNLRVVTEITSFQLGEEIFIAA